VSERDKPTGKPAPTTTQEAAPDEPFLKRWSRLKREEEASVVEAAETGEGELVAAEGEVPAIDPADLPDIESLDKDSDYTVFMQEGVPDELRSLALRKLFASNPVFSVLDGLNEYDDDYSKLGIVTQAVKTAYKVGRGFLEEDDLVKIDGEDETEDIEDVDDIEPEAPAEIAEGETPAHITDGLSDATEAGEPVAAKKPDGKPVS